MITKSQKEILLITQEECAEVTQAISKVFRFGIEGKYNNISNRNRLTEEIGDLLYMIKLMIDNNIIHSDKVDVATMNKKTKLQKWSNIFGEKNE